MTTIAIKDLPDSTAWFPAVDLDLKNGSLESIPQIVPHAALASAFHWVHIKGMKPENAQKYMEHMMRAQYGQLTIHDTVDTSAETKLKHKLNAIILGSARSVMSSYYRLETTDMNVEEVVYAGFEMRDGESDADYAARQAAIPRADGESTADYTARQALLSRKEGTFEAAPGNSTATQRAARENAFPRLTEAEKKWATGVAWLATAVPMLQGVSLVATGHHYIKQTYNIFMGAHKQCLTLGWEGLEGVVKEMGQDYFDVLFHKSAHPISPPRKMEWSRDGNMKDRLFKCGHTAADIRLPAMPSEINPVKTYLAEAKMAAPHVATLGGTIDTSEGDKILGDLAANVGRDYTAEKEKTIILRGKAWCTKVAAYVAQVVGINEAVGAAAASLATGIQIKDTLSTAHSITKLKSLFPAQYALGVAAGTALMRHTRDTVERSGKFDIRIVM